MFAPIGLGAKLVDDAPGVARRVRQELNNARLIGRLAVEQGGNRLRRHSDTTRPAVDGDDAGPIEDSFPIEGYDEMPAIDIVALLADLTIAERQIIAQHEAANRQRRTILGKISQMDDT